MSKYGKHVSIINNHEFESNALFDPPPVKRPRQSELLARKHVLATALKLPAKMIEEYYVVRYRTNGILSWSKAVIVWLMPLIDYHAHG